MSIISAADLAAHLNIPDSQDDVWVNNAVNAMNRAVVRYCGRSFDVTTTASASAREFVPTTHTLCKVDDFHTTTGLVVKIDNNDDGTFGDPLTISTDFWLEPTNGLEDGIEVPYNRLVSSSWLWPMCNRRPSVQVTAAWGWEAIPDEVFQGALIWAAKVFKRKDSPEGILGGFQDFNAVRVARAMDPDVQRLLDPYRTGRQALLLI
jgi:hypothetical protein